jgi:hypothetical protein
VARKPRKRRDGAEPGFYCSIFCEGPWQGPDGRRHVLVVPESKGAFYWLFEDGTTQASKFTVTDLERFIHLPCNPFECERRERPRSQWWVPLQDAHPSPWWGWDEYGADTRFVCEVDPEGVIWWVYATGRRDKTAHKNIQTVGSGIVELGCNPFDCEVDP